MIYVLSVVVSFVAVFLKGFQHKNVNGNHMKSIMCLSYLMAVTDVLAVSLIVRGGLSVAFSAGTGAALGMWVAIRLHDRIFKGSVDKKGYKVGIHKTYTEAKEQAQRNADLFHRPYVAFIDTSGNPRVDSLATFDKSLPPAAETSYPAIAHTPEPWHAGAGSGTKSIFADGDGLRMRLEMGGTALYPIAEVNYGYAPREDAANMARIVACVNGCEGIRNPGAVKGLLAALEFIVQAVPAPGEDAQLTAQGYNMACAAIAATSWSPMTADQLDRKYQEDIDAMGKAGQLGCPPCPQCGGVVVPWAAHIVTGSQCKTCGWNMSEGF